MQQQPNRFKEAIHAGRQQLGIWHTIRDAAVTEMLGGCGYDWVLIDCEHTPNSDRDVAHALRALAPSPAEAVVRPVELAAAGIKRLLDVGARNILVPYVQTVEEAQLAAASVAYPPEGIRGYGGSVRASGYGAIEGYAAAARAQICLMVQIETRLGMENLEAIAAVPGIDGIFIGPADLAASLGHLDDLEHPEVQEAIASGLRRIRAAGKPAGFLSASQPMLERAVAAGSVFTAVDIDLPLLRREALARRAACAGFAG